MSDIDQILRQAGRELRTSFENGPVPVRRPRRRVRPVVGLAAAAATVATFLPVMLFFASHADPMDAAATTQPDVHVASPTTAATSPVAIDTPAETTTTTPAPPACVGSPPLTVSLPDDFVGPEPGLVAGSATLEAGQVGWHYTGRGGVVELVWPPDSRHTEDAVWGADRFDGVTVDFEAGATALLAVEEGLIIDGVAQGPVVSAWQTVPTEVMTGPCDAVQMDVYSLTAEGPVRSGFTLGYYPPEGGDRPAAAIFPTLARERDTTMVVEAFDVDELPPLLACNTGPDPSVTAPGPRSETFEAEHRFETPSLALEDFLLTESAQYLPSTGYFELSLPDGSVVYVNPYDDLSGNPRPEDGIVVAVTVTPDDTGWAVARIDTSGC